MTALAGVGRASATASLGVTRQAALACAVLPAIPSNRQELPRADKTLDGMRANPRDWRIASLEAVAPAYGVNTRKPGGSHVVFEHPAVAEAVSVPACRPIKPVYVRRFVQLIDAVRTSHE